MTKFLLLTSVIILGCCVAVAQQPNDSAGGQAVPDAGISNTIINFSCSVKELNKVWLQWSADSAANGDYFIVERSNDGNTFETIGALKRTSGLTQYELFDNAPANGADFYRIKYGNKNGQFLYSKTVQVNLSGNVSFRFYPNPVDKLLIVRTEHTVELQIMDAMGACRVSKRLQPGVQVINVSALEKGNYILRVADIESNRMISEQLLKN